MASWSRCCCCCRRLSVVLAALVLAVTAATAAPWSNVEAPAVQEHPPSQGNDLEVPVECVPSREDRDAVLCRVVVDLHAPADGPEDVGSPRAGRRFLGRIGFLAGLHLGGAISSSGSLSASHSLNVFGKTMNTALSVSYGPNGYYQGPGGGRPPLNPIGPVFGALGDDVSTPTTPSAPSPDKGSEASAVLAGTISRDGAGGVAQLQASRTGIARVEAEAPVDDTIRPQNRLPVAEDIVGAPDDTNQVSEAPDGSTVAVGDVSDDDDDDRQEPAQVQELVDEDNSRPVGEEPLPQAAPPAALGVQLSSQRRTQLEAVARIRTSPTVDDHRRLFLQRHNQHVAAFNRHYAKYNGDVSHVAVYSRT